MSLIDNRCTISGIDLVYDGVKPLNIKSRDWLAYTYIVVGPEVVTRDNIGKLVSCRIHGNTIRDVESNCNIKNLCGYPIVVAVDA